MLRQILAACALALMPSTPSAQFQWPEDPRHQPSRVELLTGWRDQSGAGTHIFAIKISLAQGWKTYWRAPGDNGIAPQVTWTELSNAAGPDFHFPAPRLFTGYAGGPPVIGYQDSVVFPVTVRTADPARDAVVGGSFEFGICLDVCVPERVEFRAVLAADLDIWIDEITAARGSAPLRVNAAENGLRFVCRFQPDGQGGFFLSAEIDAGLGPLAEFAAAPEYPDPGIGFSSLTADRAPGGAARIQARMASADGHQPMIDRSALTVTIVTPQSAVEYSGCRGSA